MAVYIQGFAAALKAGITKTQLDATVGVHPTAAEEVVQMRSRVRTVGRGTHGATADATENRGIKAESQGGAGGDAAAKTAGVE